jgi:hypothetical protein
MSYTGWQLSVGSRRGRFVSLAALLRLSTPPRPAAQPATQRAKRPRRNKPNPPSAPGAARDHHSAGHGRGEPTAPATGSLPDAARGAASIPTQRTPPPRSDRPCSPAPPALGYPRRAPAAQPRLPRRWSMPQWNVLTREYPGSTFQASPRFCATRPA